LPSNHILKSSLAFAACWLAFPANNGYAGGASLDIGDRSQLVADKTWIQTSERATFIRITNAW
jgi:hypothetical protein